MLREIKNVRQRPDEGIRRWFADDDFDLIVWYSHEHHLLGFQLCYDKRRAEQAVTWRADGSVTASQIDGGDDPVSGPKRAAILVENTAYDQGANHALVERFRNAASEVDDYLVGLVCDKLAGRAG